MALLELTVTTGPGILTPEGRLFTTPTTGVPRERSSRFMRHFMDLRREHDRRLKDAGLVHSLIEQLGVELNLKRGLALIREVGVKQIDDQVLRRYSPLAYAMNYVYPDLIADREAEKYATVLAVQYLVPHDHDSSVYAKYAGLAAIIFRRGGTPVDVLPASESVTHEQARQMAAIVDDFDAAVRRPATILAFCTNHEAVLSEPFAGPNDMLII